MKIIRDIKKMQTLAEKLRLEGKRIALVPTMGALHDGHLSLIQLAKKKSDCVIVSIFVNPTQFSPSEDLSKYPRSFKKDRELAEKEGADIIFFPEAKLMYPDKFETYISCENTAKILEGEFRPTHFKGVTTIVMKLFNITSPHVGVFGQKDAQQAFIINKMITDLNMNINLLISPIIREKDGLAMSSRNVYLNSEERNQALCLIRSLKIGEKMIFNGVKKFSLIKKAIEKEILSSKSAKIDYINIVDSNSFQILSDISKCKNILILLAVRIGKTRLIDNQRIIIRN